MKCTGYLLKRQQICRSHSIRARGRLGSSNRIKLVSLRRLIRRMETRKQLFFVLVARGGELYLTVKRWDLDYAKQMATCGRNDYHSVFGAKISNQDVDAVALPGGGSTLKFKLQPSVPFSDPALFNNPDSYPLACIVGFRGNQQVLLRALA
jgi:hypothetical protein